MDLILTDTQLRRSCPSIYATHPVESVSDRYAFLPTSEVIDIMRDTGFHPVKATQSTSRDEARRGFSRHCLRFRHADHLNPALHQEHPEIVLVNSHDKSACYFLSAGIYRLICKNGLTVSSSSLGSFSIRHSGNRDTRKQIIDTTAEIAAAMPGLMQTVADWKAITLTRQAQLAFAQTAHELKANPAISTVQLLTSRRPEDDTDADGNRSLWVTLNTIQESIIAGGLAGRNERGRQIRTRPIKAVAADLAVNRRLWALAEQVAERN